MLFEGDLWQKSPEPVTQITHLIALECDVYHDRPCHTALREYGDHLGSPHAVEHRDSLEYIGYGCRFRVEFCSIARGTASCCISAPAVTGHVGDDAKV